MTRQASGGGGEMKGRLEAGKRGEEKERGEVWEGGGSAGGRCRNQLTTEENICL